MKIGIVLPVLSIVLVAVILLSTPLNVSAFTPTLVQSKAATGSGTATCAFSSSVTSGDLLVVGAVDGSQPTTFTISDTRGSTFTKQVSVSSPRQDNQYTAILQSSGADNISVTSTSGTDGNAIFCLEFSGGITQISVAQTATNSTNGGQSLGSTAYNDFASPGINVSASTLVILLPVIFDSSGTASIGQPSGFSSPLVEYAAGNYLSGYSYNTAYTGGYSTFRFSHAGGSYSNYTTYTLLALTLNPPTTITETAFNVPDGAGLSNSILFMIMLLIPWGIMISLPVKTKNADSYILLSLIGLTFGAGLGTLAGVTPYTVIFLFGGILGLYVWRGRSGGSNPVKEKAREAFQRATEKVKPE